MQKTPQKYRLGLAGVVAASCISALAGSATYDFTTDPKEDPQFIITSNLDAAPWLHPDTGEELGTWEGKNGNPGGYFAVTRSVGSQATQMLFPDFDNGLIVKAFTFECDLRLGNPTGNAGRPADGFSISYARSNDPAVQNLIDNPGSTDTGQYAVAGGSENGTKTGIAISFDTWSGNVLPDGADVEGIIVRVDNVTVSRTAMPTRNGTETDITSLQTGPYDAEADGAGAGGKYEGLSWVKLGVVLADNGELTVTYKGAVLVDKFQTGFAPSAGRLIMAGRTGGANQNNHLDNIKITTFAADKALFAGGSATAEGYTLLLSDSGQSVVNQSTIKVKIDGADVTPTSITKDGSTTTIRITTAPNWLVSGSVHVAEVAFSDTLGAAVTGTRNITVAAYNALTPAMEVTGVNKSQRGFLLRTWYLANEDGSARPDLANSTERAEQQLFGELGVNAADNLAELNQTIPGTANKYLVEPEYLNHDQQGLAQGMFTENAVDAQRQAPEKQIPGINPADLNNLASEALFFVDFPTAGLYTFGVNSDDGFAMYAGRNPLDRFQVDGVKIGEFSGGRGTDANVPQTLFGFLVEKAGTYPLRFIWEEGGGGANFEVYQQLADGTVALINDSARAASVVKAYWDGPRTARAYISKISPGAGVTAPNAKAPVEITITDDGTTVVDGSVKLLVNGSAVTSTVTKAGKNTVVKYQPASSWGAGANTITIQYAESGGGSRDQTFSLIVRLQAADLPASSFVIEAEHRQRVRWRRVRRIGSRP
ncbi:MAG: PA14 domain-containing protein [Limisphaerales bacterium]